MKKRTKITFSLTLVICLLLLILPAAPVVAVEAEETLTSSITETATIGTPTVAEETAAVQEELPVLQLDADCQILRHVDPEVFAAGNHIARLPEEETLSSYVFLNADGSKTAYFMDQPVKFENTDGAAVEKNLTLTAATEGYTTTQNDIQLTIPTDPTNGIRLVYNNHYITLIPQGGTLTAGAQATDGFVTYPDYYGEGMSLRYTPTLSGVKEDILLDSYSGVNSFTFRLNTGGLNLYQASGRYFLAESKTSADRIELGDVVAYDANTQFSIGTMTAQTIMAGQSYMLTLTVDEAFLTDENTVYPVIIDPTMEVRASNSSSNIIDAPIFDGYPNTNYGNFIFNRVGKVSAYGVGRTVVKLPTLTESDTYTSLSADNITSVKFYVKEASGTAAISVSVYPLVGNSVWTESNVTWNNAGSADGAAIDTQSLSYTNWKSFDITSLVKKWKTGDYDENCGFIMIGSSTTNKSFFASEHSTADSRPYVVMTYIETTDFSLKVSVDYNYLVVGQTRVASCTTSPSELAIVWTSSNPNVATIDNSGVITGIAEGYSMIQASYYDPATQTTISDSKAVIVYDSLGLKDNTKYYIMNYQSRRLLTLETATNVDGTNVSTKERNSTSIYQWKLEKQSDGRFQLYSAWSSSMVLNVTGTNIDIFTDSNTESSKFTIFRIPSGKYQGLYYVLHGKYYVAEDENNNVYLTSSASDATVWSFFSSNKRSADLYSFDYYYTDQEENVYHYSSTYNNKYFTTVFETALGYISYAHTNSSAEFAYARLQNYSSVFAFRGHGNTGLISFIDDEGNSSGLFTVNESMASAIGVESNSVYIDEISDNGLAMLRCVLYIGCRTGGDISISGTTYNLVDATYAKGAHFVLGTTEKIYTADGNNWLKYFLDYINAGYSIEESCQYTNDDLGYISVPTGEYETVDDINVEIIKTVYGLPTYSIGDDTQYLNMFV